MTTDPKEPTLQPVVEATPLTEEQPQTTAASQPTEEPTVIKPTEETVEVTAEEPVEVTIAEPAAETTEVTIAEPIEEPIAEPTEVTIEEPIAEPIEVTIAEPAEEPVAVKPAEEAAKTPTAENSVEHKDINDMSVEQLCELLVADIENKPLSVLRSKIEQIKVVFYRKIRTADEAAKGEFVAAGGVAEEYKATLSAQEVRFKELLALYRDRRDKATAASEEQKEANHKAKLEIIEELRSLVSSTETLGQTFAAFRELQSRWKDIGIVPIGVTKDLWETYHHHTENFYNFVKINKELRDIDLKRNYETKLSLCEQAEVLLEMPSAVAAFSELQKLHDNYREAGPVAEEFKEQLWERFKAASSRANKRHQEHYDTIREEQERNLALKGEICEKIETFATLPLVSAKEWNEVQDQITELQKVWKTIGFAPKKDNNAIYERFRGVCDKFFEIKRQFFAGMRGEMDDNLQAKTDLAIQAESLAESDDWKATTEALVELQKEWKKIGPVSRKHSDAIWRRFRAACDKFFERKSEHFKESDKGYNENLEGKLAIIEELKALQANEELSFDLLKEVMQRYSGIGFVPIRKKEALSKEYKELCDVLFDTLRAKEGSTRIDKFRHRISASYNEEGNNRVGMERTKLYNRVRLLEAEVKLLENNIGFFANSKGADSMIADVERKIEKSRAEIAELIEKIKIIDNQ